MIENYAENYEVLIGLLEDGQYVAASTTAPYFCCLGKTEDEVKERVDKALVFYLRTKQAKRLEPVSKRETLGITKLVPLFRFRPHPLPAE